MFLNMKNHEQCIVALVYSSQYYKSDLVHNISFKREWWWEIGTLVLITSIKRHIHCNLSQSSTT